MSRSRRARWRLNMALAAIGGVLVVALATEGQWPWSIAVAVLLGGMLRFLTPRPSESGVTHWAAQDRHVRDGIPIIYVRPISWGCFLLRLALGPRGQRAVWVDIWADDEAAAFVRDLNDGREVVPTVILSNGDAVSRPDPARVARDLGAPGGSRDR